MDGRTARQDAGGWELRWNPDLAERAVREGDWPNRTIADDARDLVRTSPDRIQMIDGAESHSCQKLYDAARCLAGCYERLGLTAGEVVSFQLPNWWEAAVVNLAAAMTGVVVNPIVPINRDAEVTYMLNESRSRIVFIPRMFRKYDYVAMIRRILPRLTHAPIPIVVRACAEGMMSFDEATAGPPLVAPRVVDPDAVKLLMYTSGTTGRPKGVLHSHNSLNADSLKMTAAMSLGPDDLTFSPSPVTHISGYLWALNVPWTCNVPVMMCDVWDAAQAFDRMKARRCSFMLGATPFLQDLLAVARSSDEQLESLRYYMCGGAAVPPSLMREAADYFPNCIPFRLFGATEAPSMTRGPSSREQLDLGAETDGRLYRCEVKIVDVTTGEPVAAGEEGEILVREPSMALGYARAEDNADAYDADGFFRMGDLGRLVADDHIICTGRKKDLIVRAGENISAKEIEDVLILCPRIEEVAVVAMPSGKTGEKICAFIVPVAGETIGLPDIAAKIEAAGLARQKTPEWAVIVSELPRTVAGKVRKDQLRIAAAGIAAREQIA